ncbi:MAG: alpha/beta hydrolase [Candidatus Thiodiazotropha taylori]
MNSDTHVVTLPDGRRLAYAEYGDPAGTPTLYFHGFPGSRLEAQLFDLPARKQKLRVLAPDRNGIGLSDPKPNRCLLDWSRDVSDLLDSLDIEKVHLVAVSGGGPYALACTSQLAKRIHDLTLVCPLGPLDQVELMNSLRWPGRYSFTSVRTIPLLPEITYGLFIIPLTQRWPQIIYQMMVAMAPPADTKVLNRHQVRKIMCGSISEAARQGRSALLYEMSLYAQPWGFDISKIKMPVHLWHGTADETVPMIHGNTIAKSLSNCKSHYIKGEGHFSLPIDYVDQILSDSLSRG